MNSEEINIQLKSYIKQINNAKFCNFKLLIVINLLDFLIKEKEWLNSNDTMKNTLIRKIDEFTIVLNEDKKKYHSNLINMFYTKSKNF